MATGEVTWAWVPDADGVGRRMIENHPRTDLPIVGFRIPMWREVRSLVEEAARRFLPIRTVGWDVAVTANGPILIEANELYQNTLSGEWVVKLRQALEAEKARLTAAKA